MVLKQIRLLYQASNQTLNVLLQDKTESVENRDMTLTVSVKETPAGSILSLCINPKTPVTIQSLSLSYQLMENYKKMLVNGIQSWSHSRELGVFDSMKRINPIVGSLYKLDSYGDYHFTRYNPKKGCFHSFSFTHFRDLDKAFLFLGSLDEASGYTIFEGNLKSGELKINKDCAGLSVAEKTEVMSLFISRASEKAAFDEYFSRIEGNRNPPKPITGWTSWYNYYAGITEEILLSNLTSLREKQIPIDIFQIDDGYQEALGDWLSVNKKFPMGMGALAKRIKEAGYKAGLWVAPFVCESKSRVFIEHPDWILRHPDGKPVYAGYNNYWGKFFYALDITLDGVKAYLKEVFDTVLHDWGYDMVKLDFLYAAALIPNHGKPRGALMQEAMELLNALVGDKLILGCGVPMFSAFKKTDYCRIGSDVVNFWEDAKLAFVNYRERVSTFNSLCSTLSRYFINGRGFGNDPDVFFLRDNNNQLSAYEKETLLLLNYVLGSLVFFSDHVGDYNDKNLNTLRSLYPRVCPEIAWLRNDDNLYRAGFKIDGREYLLFANLRNEKQYCKLPEGLFYSKTGEIVEEEIHLAPHQSLILLKADIEREICIVGSDRHLIPACDIEYLRIENNKIIIKIHNDSKTSGTIFVKIPNFVDGFTVNGQYIRGERMKGLNIVKYNR